MRIETSTPTSLHVTFVMVHVPSAPSLLDTKGIELASAPGVGTATVLAGVADDAEDEEVAVGCDGRLSCVAASTRPTVATTTMAATRSHLPRRRGGAYWSILAGRP